MIKWKTDRTVSYVCMPAGPWQFWILETTAVSCLLTPTQSGNTVPHTVYRWHLLSPFPQEPSLVSRVFPISPRPALSPWGVNAIVSLRWCTPLPYSFLQHLDPFVRYADQGCFGGKEHIPLRLAQGKGPETLMELLAGKGSQTSQKCKPHLPFSVTSACKALTIPALTDHTMAAWIPLSWQLISTCPRGSLWSRSCKRFLVSQEIHCCRSGISHPFSIISSKAVWGSIFPELRGGHFF